VNVSDDRLGKDQAYLLNSNKLRNDFTWQNEINLEEGLKDTLRWVDNNLDLLKKLPADYVHKQ
jgi:dTDP-glucose 4,6-dehydratase